MDIATRWLPSGLPEDYTYVLVHVEARTPSAAFDLGRAKVDTLRASWSIMQRPTQTRSFGRPPPPLSVIRWGPLSTIHTVEGSPCDGVAWIDESFRPNEPTHQVSSASVLRKQEAWVRKRLVALNVRPKLERLLRGYVSALDNRDTSPAFVELWSVFEHLTGGLARNGGYETNLRKAKACFQFSDETSSNWFWQELKHLHRLRNSLIHRAYAGLGGERDERHERRMRVQQLRWIVEGIFRFLLANVHSVGSLERTYELLDLPLSPVLLRSRRKLYSQPIRLHSPPK